LSGSLGRAGTAGANALRFTGRLAGHKLRAGRYRLVAAPAASGSGAAVARAAFRIVLRQAARRRQPVPFQSPQELGTVEVDRSA
jgi:hypothetical protein